MILATAAGCDPGEQEPLSCDGAEEAQLDDFVSQRNCSRDSVVITFRRDRPHSEIWILEEPTATIESPSDSSLEGRRLPDSEILQRSQALVQINGHLFQCGFLCWDSDREDPVTRVFESTHQISTNTLSGFPDFPLSFGPRSDSGIAIHLGDAGADPLYRYNVVGSTTPIIQGGECSEWPWEPDDVTAMGYGVTAEAGPIIVMTFVPKAGLAELCKFMKELGVTDAVMMDGGSSAGMYLNSSNAIGGQREIGSLGRRIPYRIGLVTLEPINRVTNGDFELPDLNARPGGTPTAVHSYAGNQMAEVQWQGAMFLYNAPRYNELARHNDVPPVASHGKQVAALRPRDLETRFVAQHFEVPANRYCMLHFAHGFHPAAPGCSFPLSRLEVIVQGTSRGTEYHYYSSYNTTGLDEEWLRFTTAPEGNRVDLLFRAWDPFAEGPCEVLVDDVRVSCVP